MSACSDNVCCDNSCFATCCLRWMLVPSDKHATSLVCCSNTVHRFVWLFAHILYVYAVRLCLYHVCVNITHSDYTWVSNMRMYMHMCIPNVYRCVYRSSFFPLLAFGIAIHWLVTQQHKAFVVRMTRRRIVTPDASKRDQAWSSVYKPVCVRCHVYHMLW